MELPSNYDEMSWQERKACREQYVVEQKGICCHCKKDLSGKPDSSVSRLSVNRALFPDSFFKWPVHLHHCHKTGITIGAVHNYCNAVLWQYHNE